MKRYFKYLLITLIVAFVLRYFFFPYANDKKSRILVIGGGLAGLSAAITAANENPSSMVYLFDKEPRFGGNSAKATSGINAVFTEAQFKEEIEDSYDLFSEDTLRSGKGNCNPELVDTLVTGSTSAISFLTSFGVDVGTLSQLGGHSAKRTHRSDPNKVKRNIGGHIVQKLIESLDSFPNIRPFLSRKVTDIRKRSGPQFEITFLKMEENKMDSILVDIIILTSGGFGADTGVDGLLNQYNPSLQTLPTTNGEFSRGDGVKLMKALDAALVDMKEIQVHPTGFTSEQTAKDPKVFLAPEALRGSGGILMKHPGTRFVNELGTRDFVSEQINEHCPDLFHAQRHVAHLILGEESAQKFGVSKLGFYESKGLVKQYANAEELCDGEGFDLETFETEIMEYNQAAQSIQQDKYGKTVFPSTIDLNARFFRLFTTPSIHYSMGGLKINKYTEVMDKNGRIIENVFAAGEVTGGVHGKNRLGGNSLLECVVFGRIAGKRAAGK